MKSPSLPPADPPFRFERSELGPIVHYTGDEGLDRFLAGIEDVAPEARVVASATGPNVKSKLPKGETAAATLRGLEQYVHLVRVDLKGATIVWERLDPVSAEVAVLARSWTKAAALMVHFVTEDRAERLAAELPSAGRQAPS